MKRKRGSRRSAPRKRMRTGRMRRAPKKYKRNATSYTRSSTMPVADSYFTKLRYFEQSVEAIAANPNITAVSLFQTSLFDPNASLGGHQPLWFDQLCPGQYTNYRVYGFKYRISIIARTNVDSMWTAFVRHTNTTALDNNPRTASERVDTKRQDGTPQGGSKTKLTFTGFVSLAKIRGISKERVRSDPEFEGSSTFNPPAMAYLHLGLYHTSGSTLSFDVTTKLEYYAKFTGRVTPTGS